MMSDSEFKQVSSDEETTYNTKFTIMSLEEVKALSIEKVYSYIDDLHRFIKKQGKKLKKYKSKAKKNSKRKSNQSEVKHPEPDPLVEVVEEAKTKDFINDIKAAAEEASANSGFVYEPTSGLYYDFRSGYYYDSTKGLYYDGETGSYYKYNNEENRFEFQWQIQSVQDDPKPESKKQNVIPKRSRERSESPQSVRSEKNRHKKRTKHIKVKPDPSDSDVICISDGSMDAREDGELSDSSSQSSHCSNIDEKYEDIAKKYPPALRLIVTETNVPELKIGNLFLITYTGGSVGREGDHDVIIPDKNVSKVHLKLTYNDLKSNYECQDMGSRNGTMLNGSRLSSALQESEPYIIEHGSILQFSQTKLLCHIHEGTSTCNECEPGLLQSVETEKVNHVKIDTPISHKDGLKQLQKRYGLEKEKYVDSGGVNKEYNDRAAVRRKVVGSSTSHEKTEIASLEQSISSENKGFKMLSKMGWSQGQKIGKNDSGLLEPIELKSNQNSKGLGCTDTVVKVPVTKKSLVWKKTMDRYQNAPKVTQNIFANSDDDEDES